MDGFGRPRVYQDHDSFAAKVDEYFSLVEDKGKKPTLAGLALHLGFDDRESIATYGTYGPDFSRTVKRAKLMMEDNRQQILLSKELFTPGVSLDLMNNHGWKNKSDIELTGADGGPLESITRIELVGVMPSDDATD